MLRKEIRFKFAHYTVDTTVHSSFTKHMMKRLLLKGRIEDAQKISDFSEELQKETLIKCKKLSDFEQDCIEHINEKYYSLFKIQADPIADEITRLENIIIKTKQEISALKLKIESYQKNLIPQMNEEYKKIDTGYKKELMYKEQKDLIDKKVKEICGDLK